ncbi:MAG TPA: hypothetical protein VFS20_15435 [Longimicrobium sp.]|nr:hypothetical protein [Longimicrobium sp.]
MKGMTRNLATLALVAACAACDGAPTASSALAAPADGPALAQSPGVLTFSSTQSYTDQSPQTATGALARIDFTGSLTTGQPCYVVTGSHTARNGTVTLTVTATRTGDVCAQVVTHNNYQGSVAGLTPGTYTFTVIHSVNNTRTTAFTGTVVVQ